MSNTTNNPFFMTALINAAEQKLCADEVVLLTNIKPARGECYASGFVMTLRNGQAPHLSSDDISPTLYMVHRVIWGEGGAISFKHGHCDLTYQQANEVLTSYR